MLIFVDENYYPPNRHFHQRRLNRKNHRKNYKRDCSNERRKNVKLIQCADSMAPPYAYADTIAKAIVTVKERGLKICSMDMETADIRKDDGSIASVPIWVAIIDGNNDVVYHEFIRHPTSTLVESGFGTECHGLTKKDVNKGRFFGHVRREIINVLRKYDRIIVSGQYKDFAALFLSIEEHMIFLPKIVCMSSYYNCRSEYDGLGLRYVAFLMFNVILHDGPYSHSALVDASYTLYLYLMDFDRIERVKATLKTIRNVGQGYQGYVYPKNVHMASLLRNTMYRIGDWPAAIKCTSYASERVRQQKKLNQMYYSFDYIPGTRDEHLPFPYRLDNLRKNSLFPFSLSKSPKQNRF